MASRGLDIEREREKERDAEINLHKIQWKRLLIINDYKQLWVENVAKTVFETFDEEL